MTDQVLRKFAGRQLPLRASFYRGGTSRGLLVSSARLAMYDQASRDAILCAAMGSPDPDGRQIDGLGGGVSSLSKVAIINGPGRGNAGLARVAGNPFPGVPWAEDSGAASKSDGWDVVYRFGQVPINGNKIDWGSTCGNMMAAVAQHSILTNVLTTASIDQRAKDLGIDPQSPGATFLLPVKILTANNGNRVVARVPVTTTGAKWSFPQAGDCRIAGVPGSAAPILIETPLDAARLLPTGNVRDEVTIGGKTIPVTVIDAGLPVIFVDASSLGVELDLLTSHPASLDADGALMQRIEDLRRTASSLSPYLSGLYFPGSASPKVCLVHPRASYLTTGGEQVSSADLDCLIRAVSVGQVHRTVPATTLSALGVASTLSGSLVADAVARGKDATSSNTRATPPWMSGSVGLSSNATMSSLSVGQPAGISSTYVRTPSPELLPDAIIMERTARLLMDGNIMFPAERARIHEPFVQLSKESGQNVFPADRRYLRLPSGHPWFESVNKEARRTHNETRETAPPVKTTLNNAGSPGASRGKQKPGAIATAGHSSHRSYSSIAGGRDGSTHSSAADPTSEMASPLHLYRHLTRAIRRHNALPRPHRSNLQRLLRDEFKALPTTEIVLQSQPRLAERVENTLLLLLSASHLQNEDFRDKRICPPEKWSPRGRELLMSLSSLTYHHLSPLTVFSPKRQPRLVGGSDAAQARALRARRKIGANEESAALMSALHNEGNDLDGFGGMSGSQQLLTPLAATARPRRGPITSPPPPAWNGQRPELSLNSSQQSGTDMEQVTQLQRTKDRLEEEMQSDHFQMHAKQKERDAIASRYKAVKGFLKGMNTMAKRHAAQQELDEEFKSRLLELVEGAENAMIGRSAAKGMLCGGRRFSAWAQGLWISA